MSAIPQKTRQAVYERDEWCCRRCGINVEHRPEFRSIHHRQGRRGSDAHRMSNLVLLCGSGTTGCHGYLTEHPAEAYAGGWSVKRISVDDPEEVPIHVQGGLLWLTDEAGAWTLPRKEQP